jgi:hypothetical protein
MEKDDRRNGGSEQAGGSREPQGASRPAPGKVTHTSRLSPGRGAAVQRKAAAPSQEAALPQTRSRWDLTMDPWMDAAHRGVAALADRGQDQAHAAGPIQAKGLQESPDAPVSSSGQSGGAAMPDEVRGKMETALGADFSSVRIHEGPDAESVGALAYTQGTDIHFAPGQYQPGSQRGQELLGHELTHVVQQSQGRVQATRQAKGVDINDDASLEREADEMGAKAARGERSRGEPAAPTAQLRAAPAVQMQQKADVYSAADAAAVKDTWAKDGALTETDTVRTTEAYARWKKKFSAALAKEKGKQKPSLSADELTAASDWVTKLEARERWKTLGTGAEPADPGAAPAAVTTLAGAAAPALVFEKIKQYDVTVPGGDKYSYTDHVRSPYTVRDEGVGTVGKVGGKTKISDVFDKAGVPASDPELVKKVFSVLSSLEGNFDAINTYDAGYISIGLIQFISGKGGTGSLISALRDMKTKAPAEFNTYFHSLGIDVDSKGLVVVDPASGTVLHGEDAVQKVIQDKRLAAVFQKAGAQSAEFQYAQARTAYSMYYMPDKSFSLNLQVTKPGDAKPTKVGVSGSYKDVLTSEAGKVAIVDRGVQFGTAGGKGSGGAAGRFLDACQEVVNKHKLTAPTAAELAKYEKEIVARVKNRYDVFGDASLTQPPEPPAATNQPATPAATPKNTP